MSPDDTDCAVSSVAVHSSPPPTVPAASYAPGWYPDPTRRFDHRYYNGSAWTGDVASHGERMLDPLQPFAAAAPSVQHRSRNGIAIAAMVLAIGTIVTGWIPFWCFAAAAAAVAAIVLGIIGLRHSRNGGVGRGFAVAALVLSPFGLMSSGFGMWFTQLAIREFTNYTNVGDYQLGNQRCDVKDATVRFEGDVSNRSARTQSYHLVLHFNRVGTENTLYSATADVTAVLPGSSGHWNVFNIVDQTELDCVVASVSGPLPFND